MNKYTVFGKQGCGYCTRAKQVLTDKGLPFKYVDIHEENISKADLEKTVGKPVHTVPQIFLGTDYIGGYTELDAYLKSQSAA